MFNTGTQVLAQLFSDDGITSKPNPTSTNANGAFDFFIADGRYDVVISGPNISTFTISNLEISDITQASPSDAEWQTQVVGFQNQGVNPTPPTGFVNLYSKSLDKNLYFKDDTGKETPVGGASGANILPLNNNFTGTNTFSKDMILAGPNPYVDIRAFGARAVNPNVTPQIPGITANAFSGLSTVNLSSASTFQNGDGVVIFGAGQPHSMPTPGAPTVTPSVALAGTCTGCPNTPSTSGSTTYNYKIVARDRNGGLTAASPVGSTVNGLSSLNQTTISITSLSRSGQTVTVTLPSAHPLVVGCNSTNCGEVYISNGNGLSDVSFAGWFTVTSAGSPTTFTYVGPPSTTLDASTSATGGSAVFYALNKIAYSQVPGAVQYLLCSDRQSPGVFAPVGISNPSTANNSDLEIDDYGSPWQPDNWKFPDIYVGACTASSPTSDSLVTTIANGAGSTTLTLANAAGTTVTGATILFDNGSAIVAAASSINNTGTGQGALFIPAIQSGNQFVVNSWTTFPSGTRPYSVLQAGPLYLRDTVEITASAAGNNKWIGDTIPQGSQHGPADWTGHPTITYNGAFPALLFSGQQFGFKMEGLNFSNVQVNGGLALLVEGGFNQTFNWLNFNTGNGFSDFLSQGLQLRGTAGQGNTNVSMNWLSFAPGGGGDGASHAPTLNCRPCSPSIQNVYSVHRGMLWQGGGGNLGIGGVAYINGGGTPLLTIFANSSSTTNALILGNFVLDTIAHPAVAALGSQLPLISLNGLGTASSGINTISGAFNYIQAFGNTNAPSVVTTWANTAISVTNSGTGSSGQQSNINQLLGDTVSLFTRTSPLPAPACSVSAGGSVGVGTYNFAVVPVWQNGGLGTQSFPSANVSVTSGNQTVTCNWTAQSGNPQGYKVAFSSTGVNGPYGIAQFAPIGCGVANVTSAVWSNGNVCGNVLSGVPTGGPTIIEPGLQGIATPSLVLTGSTLTAPGSGVVAVSTGGLTSGDVPKYSGTSGLLLDSGVAASSLATVPLAVGSIAPGTNGQCVNTSGSAAVWGSCAGTAGVQLSNVNTSPITVTGASTQPLMTFSFPSGALNTQGKTIQIKAGGFINNLGTASSAIIAGIVCGVPGCSSGGLMNFSSLVVPGQLNWYFDAQCTNASPSGTLSSCIGISGFSGTTPSYTALGPTAGTSGTLNWTGAVTVLFQSTASGGSAATSVEQNYLSVEQLN